MTHALLLALCLAACGPSAPNVTFDMPNAALTPPAIPCEDTPVTYLGGDVGLSNRAQGLWTNPNVQTDAPDGALHKAENVELDRSGLARPRVGQERLSAQYANASERFRAGIEYQGYLFEFASIEPGGAGKLYRRDLTTGTVTLVDFWSPPAGVQRPRFTIAEGDLYVTSSLGIFVFDGPLASPAVPGLPKGIAPSQITEYTFANGPFPAFESTAAYRVVVAAVDAEGRIYEGEPSGRVVWRPTTSSFGGAKVLARIPSGVVAGMRLRLYRTLVVAGEVGPPAKAGQPGDTMYLAGEHVLTSSDLSGTSYEFTDIQPDALLGQPLYTNPTQGSILASNRQPPYASDMLAFREDGRGERLLLAAVRWPHTFTLRLLGVPPVGTVLTIGGSTYTAVAGTAALNTAGQFGTYGAAGTSSSATVSEQIRQTALALVTAINYRTGNITLYADYSSSDEDPPGIITIRARTPIVPTFTAVVSTAIVVGDGALYFDPPIDTAKSSSAAGGANVIAVSHEAQPYAFGYASEDNIIVGRSGASILRLGALRSDVYTFKDGEGIFKLTPIGNGWNNEHINQEVSLLIPESLAVLDNRLFAYTNRGMVSVDAYGVDEVDVPVKDYTEALATLPAATVQAQTFAVSDPQRLCYWLWFPESAGATSATRALQWNGRADPPAWTERTDAATGGYESPSGRLYLGEPDRPNITRSRNTGTVDDFQGPDANAYTVALKWPNRAEGIPGESKQFRQVRLFFERAVGTRDTPLPVAWTFTNDYATESPVRTNQVYGLSYSTMEPDPGWQRTSDMGTEVSFPVLRQYVVVKGIEEVVSGTAPVRGR